MSNLKNRIETVTTQIQVAAQQAKRNANDITLLAVSKTKPISAISDAFNAGQRCFGENYLQEAEQKILSLKANKLIGNHIQWHFIGPIQSNKTRTLATLFDWVQSVDRLKIARRLNEQRPSHLEPLNICLQVNISEESQKAGISLDDVFELSSQVSKMPNLNLRGLMAIPEKTDNVAQLKSQFKQLQIQFTKLQQLYPEVDTLSMGMSQDMQTAIDCGSTMVRIGTAIFGQRETKEKQ